MGKNQIPGINNKYFSSFFFFSFILNFNCAQFAHEFEHRNDQA